METDEPEGVERIAQAIADPYPDGSVASGDVAHSGGADAVAPGAIPGQRRGSSLTADPANFAEEMEVDI